MTIATSIQMDPGVLDDPEAFQRLEQAQSQLRGVLSRLLVTIERYPELRATANFRDLQAQLEGTENRIAVARRDYIESVRAYNTYRRRFPTNLIAGMMGFDTIAQLEVEPEARTAPVVEFNSGDE